MRAVRGRDTQPEIRVRSAAHGLGLRFRIHRKDLPGTPDLVLRRHKAVIFVHGCFWHRHKGCSKATTPAQNEKFWGEKFRRNVERDQRNREALTAQGWNVFEIWECEVPTREAAVLVIARLFGMSEVGTTAISTRFGSEKHN